MAPFFSCLLNTLLLSATQLQGIFLLVVFINSFIHLSFIYLVFFSQNKNLIITEFVLSNQDEKTNIYSIFTGFEI